MSHRLRGQGSHQNRDAILNRFKSQLDLSGQQTEKLGLVRQLYAEATYRAACVREGVDIVDRTVDKNGDILLMISVE